LNGVPEDRSNAFNSIITKSALTFALLAQEGRSIAVT